VIGHGSGIDELAKSRVLQRDIEEVSDRQQQSLEHIAEAEGNHGTQCRITSNFETVLSQFVQCFDVDGNCCWHINFSRQARL
jgi:hypothetical protein